MERHKHVLVREVVLTAYDGASTKVTEVKEVIIEWPEGFDPGDAHGTPHKIEGTWRIAGWQGEDG